LIKHYFDKGKPAERQGRKTSGLRIRLWQLGYRKMDAEGLLFYSGQPLTERKDESMKSIAFVMETDQYYHEFQPLCQFTDQCRFGYEALLRSLTGKSPNALFQQAMELKQLYELDTWSMNHALSSFFLSSAAEKDGLLFVNLFPSTITADAFPKFVKEIKKQFSSYIHRVVIEINETISEDSVWYNPVFLKRIKELRKQGFSIALDDVGEGTATLRKIVEVSPDFIKIDRFFAQKLSQSKKKQQVVRLLVDYCRETDSVLILEGIERKEDFECALRLGVAIGQGYYIGRPHRLDY
jgi:EAL domain-containing protein (putative c-di-GMP-specific phosphodiesterase class I)